MDAKGDSGLPRACPEGLRWALGPLVLDRKAAQRRSDELRKGDATSLRHRRRVLSCASASTAVMLVLSQYQSGVLGRLPELPLPSFDANRVDASAEAYQLLGVPDATLGALNFSLTALLAGAGGGRPTRWQVAALTLKTVVDVGWSIKLAVDQATKHKAACSYCLLTTVLALASAAEAARAAKQS